MPATKGTYARRGSFKKASNLLEKRIRHAGESRGFSETRLLTHWADIVGPDIAARARPVNVSYSKGGFGATLTLLTTSAQAPMLQMELPKLRDKVNACYGYNAIARIRITQTAPTGFAEGQAQFAPKAPTAPRPDPEAERRAAQAAGDVRDDTLRQALTALGENVLRSSKRTSST
ncbi:MAG: DUF721 domain-containing protein [Pseudomonadota bacterium]